VDTSERLKKLRSHLQEAECDALFVTKLINIRYLTGFTGSAGKLWVTEEKAVLFTDGRYAEQAPAETEGGEIEVVIQVQGFDRTLNELSEGVTRLGLEAASITWEQQNQIAEWLPSIQLVPTSGIVEKLREIKDPEELEYMKEAASIADKALAIATEMFVPGTTEKQLAAVLDHEMRNHGASDRSFETIVAGGPNSALPHARPTDRPFETDDLVICDFGALVNGYHSDMTRSFRIGESEEGQENEILQIVLAAQQEGLKTVVNGVKISEVDAACRTIIEEAGYGEKFLHSTGHGVGLEIHENPGISQKSEGSLKSGQVVTVEPGIYVSGLGGVRWEDSVIVTDHGYELLTNSPKSILNGS
tara:strand:+ start:607 stop:1686 length:1080 start_codon:yes stop_codon:yes gene_type:complete